MHARTPGAVRKGQGVTRRRLQDLAREYYAGFNQADQAGQDQAGEEPPYVFDPWMPELRHEDVKAGSGEWDRR